MVLELSDGMMPKPARSTKVFEANWITAEEWPCDTTTQTTE